MGYGCSGSREVEADCALVPSCPLISLVRELAILSLVKHLLSRLEESRIRQLPFPACLIFLLEGPQK
jgi:hypothetical protein